MCLSVGLYGESCTDAGCNSCYSKYVKAHCDGDDFVLVDSTHPLTGAELDYKDLGQRGRLHICR